MSQKHLTDASKFPEFKGKLRLYAMKYCPYAQRARLVLAHKKIPFEIVFINLSKKPKWYLKLNPAGSVPCLQIEEDKCIPDSLIVAEYLDTAYPNNKLIPSNPYKNAQHKLIIEEFNTKVGANFYKILKNHDLDNDKAMLDGFEELIENKLDGSFLGGNQPAFVDLMIWPWLERLEYFQLYKNLNVDVTRFPKLIAYIQRMKELPAVKETINKTEAYAKFYEGFYSGNLDVDYDFELK